MINSFEIKKICAAGYERWVKVNRYSSNIMYWVHFIEYDEYLEDKAVTNKINIGDTIKGSIIIDLVTKYEILKGDSICGFVQSIDKSSSITAIGIVKNIEDSYTIVCSIDNLGEDTIIEFEDSINVKIGEIIEVEGSLELERE